jgi:hypothetical protein
VTGIWEQFIRRMSLMDDMFVRTGAIRKGDAPPPAMRDAVERCAGCTAETECSHWLEKAAQGSRPPAFCPNSDLIARLRVIGDATVN